MLCPSCASANVSEMYMTGSVGEVIECQCNICGYMWIEEQDDDGDETWDIGCDGYYTGQ